MQNIIVVHSNVKSKIFNITHVRYLYNNGWCSSTTSSRERERERKRETKEEEAGAGFKYELVTPI
jgi:hypothetical protein